MSDNEILVKIREDLQDNLRKDLKIPAKFRINDHPALKLALDNAVLKTYNHACSGSQWYCNAYENLIMEFAKFLALRAFSNYSADGL